MKKFDSLPKIFNNDPTWISMRGSVEWVNIPWAVYNCIFDLKPATSSQQKLANMFNDSCRILILTQYPKKFEQDNLLLLNLNGTVPSSGNNQPVMKKILEANAKNPELISYKVGRLHQAYGSLDELYDHIKQYVVDYEPTYLIFSDSVEVDFQLSTPDPSSISRADVERFWETVAELSKTYKVKRNFLDSHWLRVVQEAETSAFWLLEDPKIIKYRCNLAVDRSTGKASSIIVTYNPGGFSVNRTSSLPSISGTIKIHHSGKIEL